jgi:hypothetical protein
MTALLVQDSMWSSFKSRQTQRVMDGVTLGAGMMVTVLLISAIHRYFDIPVMEALDEASTAVVVIGVFVVTFAFGFVIGYLVIARIRESASPHYADKEPMLGEAMMRA